MSAVMLGGGGQHLGDPADVVGWVRLAVALILFALAAF